MTGRQKAAGQDRDYVLRWFGKREKEAVRAYRLLVENGITQGRRPELVGGGLIRSMGGWSAVKSLRRSGEVERSDERVLGDGQFVASLLAAAAREIKRQLSRDETLPVARQRISGACTAEGIDERHLRSGSRRRRISAVRARLAVELTGELGLSLAETARLLGVSTLAIGKIVKIG